MAKWTSKSLGGKSSISLLVFLLINIFPLISSSVEIRIRGRAFIDAKVNHASTFLQVSGILKDDLDRGLRERSLKVTVLRGTRILSESRIKTKERGRFFFRKEFPRGEYKVQVEFVGTQHLDGDAVNWSTTLESAEVELTTMAPAFVYNPEKLIFHAAARSGEVPLVGTLDLFINGEDSGPIKLDRMGRGGKDIAKLLRPGVNTITVSLPGSIFRKAVVKTREIRYAKYLYINAESGEGLNRLRRGMSVSGKVSDKIGGVENLPLILTLSRKVQSAEGLETEEKGKMIQRLRTGASGRFSGFFFADKLSDGTWQAEITVQPRGQVLTKILPPITWSTKTEKAVLNLFALIAFLGALALLFSLLRTGLKDRQKVRKVALEKQRKRELAFVINEEMVPISMDSSVAPHAQNNNRISGVLINPWKRTKSQEWIVGAGIEIRSREKILELTSDKHGRFEAELEKGEYKIIVKKHGFVTGEHLFKIPHSGILSNFKMELIPVPLKIRRLFEAISEEKSGKSQWGYQTPQEMEKILKLAWPSMELNEDGIERKKLRESLSRIIDAKKGGTIESKDLLASVSSIVEESYFSGRMYSEETWLFMRNLALRLVSEMST